MTTRVELCKADAVAAGTALRVEAAGLTVAVFNVEGTFYVTDDACTHGPGSLSEGYIDGDVIILGKDANAVFPVKVERIDGDAVVVRDTRNGQASSIPRPEFKRMWAEADNRTVSGADLARFAEFVTPLPAPQPLTPTEPIAAEEADGGVPTGLVVAAAVALPLVVGGGYLAARRIRG